MRRRDRQKAKQAATVERIDALRRATLMIEGALELAALARESNMDEAAAGFEACAQALAEHLAVLADAPLEVRPLH